MLKGRKAPTTVPSLCAFHKGQVRPCLEISKYQCEAFTKWISKYCYASGFCTLNTTGTDVHGIMPTSVITMETKCGGVKSYTKFKRWSELTSLQSDKTSALSLLSGTKSSGSPVNKQTTTMIWTVRMILRKEEDSMRFGFGSTYWAHWKQRNQSALCHKTCMSHNKQVLAHLMRMPS